MPGICIALPHGEPELSPYGRLSLVGVPVIRGVCFMFFTMPT